MPSLRCWPVIEREFRAQSRLARVYWLRWGGAVGLILGTYALLQSHTRGQFRWVRVGPNGMVIMGDEDLGWLDRWARIFEGYQNQGIELLATMNAFVLVAIWLLVPFLTADCLSSERRQGTLGILLLTPLRAVDVVLAKGFVHGWQAAWVFLAGLPVLVIPVILGGVGWMDGLHIVLVDVAALIVALLAGMVASSLWNGPRAVAMGAACVAVFFGCLLAIAWAVAYGVTEWYVAGASAAFSKLVWDIGFDLGTTLDHALAVVLSPAQAWFGLGRSPAVGIEKVIQSAVGLAAVLGGALVVVAFMARRVRESVQERQTAREPVVQAVSLAEGLGRAPGAVVRWRRWILEAVRRRNPFLWVELRTWRGHVVPGLSVAIVFPWEAWRSMSPSNWGFAAAMSGPVWVLMAIVAFAAASCLYEEKSSGSLELLLTVPRGGRRLMVGKFTGLALQALPAVILTINIESSMLSGVWGADTHWGSAVLAQLAVALGVIGRLALAAMVGAYFGLRFRNLVPAWFASLAMLGLLQRLSAVIALRMTGMTDFSIGLSVVAVAGVAELTFATLWLRMNFRLLNRRTVVGG